MVATDRCGPRDRSVAGIARPPRLPAAVAHEKVVGDGADHVAVLQRGTPTLGEAVLAELHAEQSSSDAAGAVAVARVVHREPHAVREVVGDQRAVHTDGERLLASPTLPERLDTLRGRRA